MIDMSQIIFTGGSGLLGSEFKKILPNVKYPSSKEFNITDYDQMKEYVKSNSCMLLVHAAAFTSPPSIDKDPLRALEINIIGTSNVVKLCIEFDARLIYISTDYVFDGDKGNYKETKTTGIKIRGTGAATKGVMARGPMA